LPAKWITRKKHRNKPVSAMRFLRTKPFPPMEGERIGQTFRRFHRPCNLHHKDKPTHSCQAELRGKSPPQVDFCSDPASEENVSPNQQHLISCTPSLLFNKSTCMNIRDQLPLTSNKPSVLPLRRSDHFTYRAIGLRRDQLLPRHSTPVPALLIVRKRRHRVPDPGASPSPPGLGHLCYSRGGGARSNGPGRREYLHPVTG
jgi:hypothetical protein